VDPHCHQLQLGFFMSTEQEMTNVQKDVMTQMTKRATEKKTEKKKKT
jgi:hypothetical protein